MDLEENEYFISQFGEQKWHTMLALVTKIEKFIDYTFLNKSFIIRSLLLHADKQEKMFFETYEFLGDSILNLVISEFLVNSLHLQSPNELTNIKSKLTKNSYLAHIASNSPLKELENLYEVALSEKNISDSLESLLGAMYIDMKFQKDKIKPIILKMIDVDSLNFSELLREENLKDKKSLLNEWVLKTYGGEVSINYPYDNRGSPHKPIFYVGLKLISKDGSILYQEEKDGPFERLKDGEVAMSSKFLKKIP